jgi:hypothetical protein
VAATKVFQFRLARWVHWSAEVSLIPKQVTQHRRGQVGGKSDEGSIAGGTGLDPVVFEPLGDDRGVHVAAGGPGLRATAGRRAVSPRPSSRDRLEISLRDGVVSERCRSWSWCAVAVLAAAAEEPPAGPRPDLERRRQWRSI